MTAPSGPHRPGVKSSRVFLPTAFLLAACARDMGQTHRLPPSEQSNATTAEDASSQGRPVIVGRVVDTEGRPVDGAQVLTQADWGPGRIDIGVFAQDERSRPHCGWTNVDGRFSVSAPAPGKIRVVVRKLGYAEFDTGQGALGLYAPALFVVDCPVTDVGELTLVPGAIIEGRVVDSEGLGVADAGMVQSLSSGSGSTWYSYDLRLASTDAEGFFRVDVLGAGEHWLTVLAPGFFEGRLDVEDLRQGEFRRTPPVVLERGPVVSGSVQPVPEAETVWVWVRRGKSVPVDYIQEDFVDLGELWGEVRWIDPDVFTMAFVPVGAGGDFVIGAELPRDTGSPPEDRVWLTPVSAWSPSIQPVGPTLVVAPGTQGIELEVVPPSTLRFDVVDSETGLPIVELNVRVAPAGWIPRPLRNEDGSPRRRFAGGRVRTEVWPLGEPPGVQLTIAAAGYRAHVATPRCEPGENLALGSIELEPVEPLEVMVRDAATGEPCPEVSIEMILDTDQEALVRLHDGRHHPGEIGVREGRTDFTGRLLLSPHHGDSQIFTRAEGYLPSVHKVVGDARQIEIALDAHPRLDVLVLDSGGRAVARVPLSMDHGRPLTFTDAEGRATLHYDGGPSSVGVASWYGLLGAREDHSTEEVLRGACRDVEVAGGERLDVTLRLSDLVSLEGRILVGGQPLAGGLVFVRRGEHLAGPLTTDGRGRFRHARVVGEPFDLLFTHPSRIGYDELEVEVVDGVARCDVDLADTILEGRLVDDGGLPIAGVRLRIAHYRPSEWDEWDETRPRSEPFFSTASDGTFRLHGVPAGERFALRLEAPHVLPLEWSIRALQTGSWIDLGDIGLHRAAELRVLVRNPNSERVWIRIWIGKAGGVELQERQDWNRREIDLHYDSLEPGEYVIQVRRESGSVVRRVVLMAGETTKVEFEVP